MKKSWLKENMWIIFFTFIFILGIVFIIWMGNTRMNNNTPSLAKEMIEHEISKTMPSPNTSIEIETPNTSDLIVPVPNEEVIYHAPSEEELPLNESSDLCPTLLIKRGNKYMLFNKNMPEEVGQNPLFFDDLDQYKDYVETQRKLYNQQCPVLFLQEENNAQGETVYRMRNSQENGNVDPLLLGSVEDYFMNKTNVTPKFGPPVGPQAFNQPPTNNGISLGNYGVPVNQLEQTSIPDHPPLVEYEDANRDNKPFNQGYYGFDPTSQYVGKFTILDEIHNSTQTENKDGLSNNPMDTNWGGAMFTAEKVASGQYEGDSVQPPTVPTVLQE